MAQVKTRHQKDTNRRVQISAQERITIANLEHLKILKQGVGDPSRVEGERVP